MTGLEHLARVVDELIEHPSKADMPGFRLTEVGKA
jgi:hypothetical protein